MNFELFSHLFLLIYQVANRKKIVQFIKLIGEFDDEVTMKICKLLYDLRNILCKRR